MSDRYAQLMRSPVGGVLARRVGLPLPVELERHRPGDPVVDGRVALGVSPAGRLAAVLVAELAEIGAKAATPPQESMRSTAADVGLDASVFNPEAPGPQRFKALLYDATGIRDSGELRHVHGFLHPAVRVLERCGRVVVFGMPEADCRSAREAAAQRALEGLTRSLGKEVGRGVTVQLVLVAEGAEHSLTSTLRFLLSPRSAFVSGQVVHVASIPHDPPEEIDWERPLGGRLALVTGASRGIGEAIATTLAREGARVVGLDVPALGEDLRALTRRLDGEALELDITDAQAPAAIAQRFAEGVDVIVHNAGVTRDRTLAKMPAERWQELMDVNLSSQERIDEELLRNDLLRGNGRIVCVSSMSGIAGNAGQTNYAASKAGVIGRVSALAPSMAELGASINAVAPGFIETRMTAKMPFAIREAGRRMSSLSQGGLPIDVAETIAWFAHPASSAVNGNVIRVCGQNLLGA